jgi:hypothetical protein
MLHPVVGRIPHVRRWTATDRYELVRRVTSLKIGGGFFRIRVYNRTATTHPPLNAYQTFDGTLRTTYAARSRLLASRGTERTKVIYPAFPGYLQLLLRKCDEESDDDTARKRDSELVRCG